MKQKMQNDFHIEGILYDHKLEQKVTGPNSKAPGTPFITGTVSIATDDAKTNIVVVSYSYETLIRAKSGKVNPNYSVLENILNGAIKTYMAAGDDAALVSVNSSIGLNEFYSDRSGTEELISNKRASGGFIKTVSTLKGEDERNRFVCDAVITSVTHQDENPDRNIPAKAILHCAIFDYKNALLPTTFSVLHPGAMDYFENVGISNANPMFIELRGTQIAQNIETPREETSAFGTTMVTKKTFTYKDWIVDWCPEEPGLWDDPSTITASELSALMAQRQTDLAVMKQNQAEYKASRAAKTANVTTAAAAVPSGSTFNF